MARSPVPQQAIAWRHFLVSFVPSGAELCAAGYAATGPNIADKGPIYHFRVNDFQSSMAQDYRVWTAIPNKAARRRVILSYMLDGNAKMDRLPEALLKQLADHSPPVIVAIGYQTNLPFDLNGRATIRRRRESIAMAVKITRVFIVKPAAGQRSASYWRDIQPQVEQGIINPANGAGMGTFHGGLFVLDPGCRHPLHIYYSASPSPVSRIFCPVESPYDSEAPSPFSRL